MNFFNCSKISNISNVYIDMEEHHAKTYTDVSRKIINITLHITHMQQCLHEISQGIRNSGHERNEIPCKKERIIY